jgi:hypothetical protein
MTPKLLVLVASLAVIACSSENEPKKVGASNTATAKPGDAAAAAPKHTAKSIRFTKQEGWIEEKPTSAMR